VNFEFSFDFHFSFFALQVIWAIGISMIILGLLIRLPYTAILVIGAVIILGHNSLDYYEANLKQQPEWWYSMLHMRGTYKLSENRNLLIFYPFLPWTGLMLLGYCCGKLFTDVEPRRRKKILLRTGAAAIVFFVALRFANIYGDPGPWSRQKNTLETFFSFMNVQKYPPSLLFLSATIGPVLIFLAFVKNTGGKLSKIISVYGRVPFFYFIVHFYILHIAQVITYLARGHSVAEGMKSVPGVLFKFATPGEGYSLVAVYGIWITIVIIMYPLCKWYDNYKKNHKEKWWLSYL